MTRKDYILLAEVLRVRYHNIKLWSADALADAKIRWDARLAEIQETTRELADSLHRDNPRFDRSHFLAVVQGDKPLNSRP